MLPPTESFVCLVKISLRTWTFLLGGWDSTHFKNMRPSNWIISPGRGENKTCLKPPPRFVRRWDLLIKVCLFWTLAFGFMYYWMVPCRIWQNDDMARTQGAYLLDNGILTAWSFFTFDVKCTGTFPLHWPDFLKRGDNTSRVLFSDIMPMTMGRFAPNYLAKMCQSNLPACPKNSALICSVSCIYRIV